MRFVQILVRTIKGTLPNLYGDTVKTKFDKAVQELQKSLKVLPVGVAEAGAWRYAFIYDLVWRWLPNVAAQAREITRSQARATILARHLRNVIYSTPKVISQTFGWKASETQSAIENLIGLRQARFGRMVKGCDDDVVLVTN